MTRLAGKIGVAALALAVCAAPALAQETTVVPARVIYPGETIGPDALDEVNLKRGGRSLPEIAMAVEEIEGKVARRTLLPGRLIPISAVREPYLVEAGAPVRATFVDGGLTITISAVPLEPGSAGDLIKVRNIDSGVVFSGTVMADGSIRVGAT